MTQIRGTLWNGTKISGQSNPKLWDNLRSTPQSTQGPLFFSPQNPSAQHKKPSVQHTFPFNTKNISSTHLSVFLCWTDECVEQTGVLNWRFFVLNWRIFGSEKQCPFCVVLMGWTDGCVELRRFMCWNDAFLGLKSSAPFVSKWRLCWTEGTQQQRAIWTGK